MNIQPTLVPQNQSFELVEPCEGAFYNPPVPAQPPATLQTSSCNPRSDAPLSQGTSAMLKVVPFVNMPFGWSLSAAPSQHSRLLDGFDGVHQVRKGIGGLNTDRRADYGERYSFVFDHSMAPSARSATRARFSFIRRIGASTFAPFLAATVAESTAARDQSILPASPCLSSNTSCSRSRTPAACQSLRRHQQVLPLPQPISGGRYDQGRPVLSTKMMPVSAARLEIPGHPPFGFSGSGGNSGRLPPIAHHSLIVWLCPNSARLPKF